jgi:lipopolysaccharide transport system ATP-binding protein
MADDVVIRAEGLGKKYLIGHEVELGWAFTFRDAVVRGANNLWRKAADMARGRAIVAGDTVEEFWALKDVSFEVKRGEVLGIIGRNGAGKSTLLKILSRITEPSEGRVTINGRVASLLEVGTGFHPELSGRENIYLNGAILGMTRAEIGRKFDEIVAFSEVEKFLDTPVKRYSSGMYVRLAFAVAAHLEPEILIVDEVLSVGDAEFQQKCLGKMEELRGSGGRTVLFVSHNIAAIENLCRRALLLDSGTILQDDETRNVTRHYLTRSKRKDLDGCKLTGTQFIKGFAIVDTNGRRITDVQIGDSIIFDIELYSASFLDHPRLGIGIHSPRGERIATLHTDVQQKNRWSFSGSLRVRAFWDGVPLNVGEYRVDIGLWGFDQELETLVECRYLNIVEKDVYRTGRLPDPSFQGYLVPNARWEINSK